MDEPNLTPVTLRQQAVIEYAQKHPFTHTGDYDTAAKVLGIPKNTVACYAHSFNLNSLMPGARLKTKQQVAVQTVSDTGGLISRVKTYLTKFRASKDELADVFDCAPKTIQRVLETLAEQACALDSQEGLYSIANSIRPQEKPVKASLEELGARGGRFLIGHTADWHVSSKYCREDVITKLYEWYKERGVSKVYIAGNWIDGESKFNTFDLNTHGMSPQIHEFLRVCPRIEGITTDVLSGDDHEGWYVQREGVNIGQLLELEAQKAGRTDIRDIGYMERDIELAPGQVMRVIHAGGGSAYATSYKAQKYVESLQGGEKPRIVVMGHYHKFEFGYPREVYALQPGCCQDQSPFMRKKQIQAHVGGCILDIHVNDDGVIDEVGCQFKSFFDKQFYQHQW
jgi:hypothetical protein